jgi:RNA polymerase sigma-70 factor (ECF subfamily)
MQSPLRPLTTVDLQRQTRALGSLARALVGDEHMAEDLAQETWLAALERPPKSAGSLRQWLRTTARRLSSNQRRAAARRSDHEQRFPRGEAEESHAVALERLEVQRSVLEQVLDLREPYRTVVYLRYWEGLEPHAIAERLGAPVKTVKTRLARALVELRERLDAKHGGKREHWLAALAPIAFPSSHGLGAATATGALTLGVLLVKQVVVAVVVLAVTLVVLKTALVREGSGRTETEKVTRVDERSAAPVAFAPSSFDAATETSDRSPVLDASSDSSAQPASQSQTDEEAAGSIRVRVTMVGEPSPSASISVEARDEQGKEWPAPSGKLTDAPFEIGKLRAGKYWVSARTPGWRGSPLPVTLTEEDDSQDVEILLTALEGIVVRVRTPQGGSFLEALQVLKKSIPWPEAVVTRDMPAGGMLDPGLATLARFHGSYGATAPESDVLGELELSLEPPCYVSLLLGHLRLATQRLAPREKEVVFVLDPDQFESSCASFRVRIVAAETGETLPAALVSFATDNVSRSTVVPVREGYATFTTTTPGPGLLSVFMPHYREIRQELQLAPGADLDLGTLPLEREAILPGRVEGIEGVTDLQVVYCLRADLQRNNHQRRMFSSSVLGVEGNGAFELNLGDYEYLVWAKGVREGTPWLTPVSIVDGRSSSGPIVLKLEPTVILLVQSSRLDEDRWAKATDTFGRECQGWGLLGGGPLRFEVLPGTCDVILESPAGQHAEHRVEVGPAGLQLRID